MPNLLIVSPLREECQEIVQHCAAHGLQSEHAHIGSVPVVQIPELRLTFAKGGLGKVQFAVTTQHLLDMGPGWDAVICAGAAGGLVDEMMIGDVVVGTTSVEHDFRKKFGKHCPPAYPGTPEMLDALRKVQLSDRAFTLHFGSIASGDEDIGDEARRREIHDLTGALAVAWEGIGGARACAFSRVPFVEIRGITDAARGDVAAAFKTNLYRAMTHVAAVILEFATDTQFCPTYAL